MDFKDFLPKTLPNFLPKTLKEAEKYFINSFALIQDEVRVRM